MSYAHQHRDHGDTGKAEGRPDKVDRPSWFGSSINPAEAIAKDPLKGDEFKPNVGPVDTQKRQVTYPPNFTQETFERAMGDLRRTLGAQHVEINDGPLNDGNYYHVPLSHDGYAVLEKDYFVPSAIACPGSTADVQAIVKWANRWVFPLWPISVGRNLGYGGSAPRVPGSLVIDLGRRMNKVLAVDEKAANCLLQPGVTYIALYEELKRRGLGDKLWVDVPDLGGGSVVGNALDRGVGYTPYGDHFAQHCGMEVVLANGEVVRLGMDSMPGSKTGQCFQYGYGPYLDGMFTQSNYGIVTQMGMFLMPNPGGVLSFKNKDDLVEAVDALQPMMASRLLGNVPSLRTGMWDSAVYNSKEHYWPDHQGRPVPEEIELEILKKEGLGYWVFYGALYGPEDITRPQFEIVKSRFKHIKDVRFQLREDAPARSYLHDRAAVFAGVPTFRELAWHQWIPNAGELFFAPISGVSGSDARAQVDMCKKITNKYGFDYLGTFYIGQREMHHIVTILWDRSKPEQRIAADKCIRELIRSHAELGYGEYRSHIATADDIMSTYNWNDGAFRKLCEQLKDSLDPNGILQPGRSGVWPKSYRGQGWEIDGVSPLKQVKPEAGKL
ncbi:FAD-binding oxidoreductase [Rhodotorula paludigena]|uniref:FAD-binding oxidoreductase n=1 Tax=Rhodotorula paludigena TaxID=86838 RepID=UPI003177E11E